MGYASGFEGRISHIRAWNSVQRGARARILADAMDEELIVVADPAAGPRLRRYLPFWAGA